MRRAHDGGDRRDVTGQWQQRGDEVSETRSTKSLLTDLLHDIAGPIQNIGNCARMLANADTHSSPEKILIDVINKDSDRLAKLLNDTRSQVSGT